MTVQGWGRTARPWPAGTPGPRGNRKGPYWSPRGSILLAPPPMAGRPVVWRPTRHRRQLSRGQRLRSSALDSSRENSVISIRVPTRPTIALRPVTSTRPGTDGISCDSTVRSSTLSYTSSHSPRSVRADHSPGGTASDPVPVATPSRPARAISPAAARDGSRHRPTTPRCTHRRAGARIPGRSCVLLNAAQALHRHRPRPGAPGLSIFSRISTRPAECPVAPAAALPTIRARYWIGLRSGGVDPRSSRRPCHHSQQLFLRVRLILAAAGRP